MADSIGVVRIHQLPENIQPQKTDLLVIENSVDTWKISLERLLNTYVKELVDDLGKSIIAYINERLNDIEVIVNNNTNIVNKLEADFDDFRKAEAIRVANEKQRIINEDERIIIENERRAKETDRIDQENIRIANENQRIINENNRKSNEDTRISNENTRVTNETNRGIAENTRVTNENTRISNENTRISNENTRISTFNMMKDYFAALKIAVDRLGNHGISKRTTSTEVIQVMEISLCTTVDEDYIGLFHIQEGPDTNTILNEGFFGLMIKFVRSGGTVTGASGVMSIPDRYRGYIDIVMFGVSVIVSGEQISISIECKPTTQALVTFSRVWSNLSSYKHANVPIYEKVCSNSTPKNVFSPNGQIIISLGDVTSYPQGFINFYNKIKIETNNAISSIKPITYWPIGSIYRTSSTDNPSTILGGGTWVLLHGNGIKESVSIDGASAQYSVVIYEWERIR